MTPARIVFIRRVPSFRASYRSETLDRHTDHYYMSRAMDLASLGHGEVHPNPMVGAVLVKDGVIIGEGYHRRYGEAHAEENAIRDCLNKGYSPEGATIYCTLEPCSFSSEEKHNPPCTELLIRHGIIRAVITGTDPNPLVDGRGLEQLEQAGINVSSGILADEEAALNCVYRTVSRYDRPFVHIKAALTLDGFIAASDGSSMYITGTEARSRVMKFRRDSDAILVGGGTVRQDRPRLTVRDSRDSVASCRQPMRVVLSSSESITDGWPDGGGGRIRIENMADRSLSDILADLLQNGVRSVLVEGGQKVFSLFLKEGLWDRLTVFLAPDILGTGIPLSSGLEHRSLGDKIGLHRRTVEICGRDVMVSGYREALQCSQV